MQQTNRTLPASLHFRLEQIAEGVYAAIALEEGAAMSNAGIIDLGDHTLIFDTFGTPKAAADLKAAAEQLTGRPATYIVNSHVHSDHWWGNQVFAPHATIISTRPTREQMVTEETSYIKQRKGNPAAWQDKIRVNEERLKAETDPRWRASLSIMIAWDRYELDAMPALAPRFPNQTFDGKLVFHGTRRTVELITFGAGHTASDVLAFLPAERIAFMGDLAFFQSHPLIATGDPQAWTKVIERVEELDLKVLVPGHGPLGTRADLALEKQYIAALEALAAQVIETGRSIDEAARGPIPSPFDAWQDPWSAVIFSTNLRFLCQRLSEK